MSPGGIAAIVIAIIAVALIAVFVVIKLYGKKFRRPGADGEFVPRLSYNIRFEPAHEIMVLITWATSAGSPGD